MGFATPYEVWVNPMLREWTIFVPMVCFYFFCQFFFSRVLPYRVPNWKKLSVKQHEDIVVRCCSIVNGAIMFISAVMFINNMHNNHWRFSDDASYRPMPGYRFFRVSICAYFAWDIVVCIFYKWSISWKLHGVVSFIGTYMLMFPYADDHANYYTGCFELSNAFLHSSVMMRTISSISDPATQQKLISTLNSRAAICEYIFAALYALIRVLGGSYVIYSYLSSAFRQLWSDRAHAGEPGYKLRVHDETAVYISMTAISILQCLQYVWFATIVKTAIGGEGAPPDVDGESVTKKRRDSKSVKKD